ncbi:Upstream-binding protein 1 [Toxocara canis]|uniref:Upstream-binding protein 1 n=1 Tax=Toxocara canis TaxID=6265 RepID=A0A0B2UVM0_TOXCA|nr:Upstream-binding protein 1 [Toxocara canis]
MTLLGCGEFRMVIDGKTVSCIDEENDEIDEITAVQVCPMECPCDISTSFDVQNRENQQEWMHEATVAGGEAQGWVSNAMPIATFEFILMAPTSAAIPIHEEPVTFLNQNEPYEVKCHKSETFGNTHRLFRTVVTLCFESRKNRMQAKELVAAWRARNCGKRFVEFDIAMSSNITDIKYGMFSAEFAWDGTEPNTSVFLKFFVASTDFIVSFGEKGQPFRLVFQTFPYGSKEMLQQSSSQIQIFKLRGAIRKRQTEREKAAKLGNQEQFQPAYDYTILLGTPFHYEVEDEPRIEPHLPSSEPAVATTSSSSISVIQASSLVNFSSESISPQSVCSSVLPLPVPQDRRVSTSPSFPSSIVRSRKRTHSTGRPDESYSSRETSVEVDLKRRLRASCSSNEVAEWLRVHRFNKYLHAFAEFDGSSCILHQCKIPGEDLLRLNVDELKSLMGNDSDAIRLFNATRRKPLEPQRVVYIAKQNEDVYSRVALHDCTVDELKSHLQQLIDLPIDTICVRGPKAIRVVLTDEENGNGNFAQIGSSLSNPGQSVSLNVSKTGSTASISSSVTSQALLGKEKLIKIHTNQAACGRDLFDEPYYHGYMTGIEAEEMLGDVDGTFLVHKAAVRNKPNVADLIRYHNRKRFPVSKKGIVLYTWIQRQQWQLYYEQIQLLDKVGQDDFGESYRGKLARGVLNRDIPVTIKTFKAEKMDADSRIRFLRESNQMLGLKHKNVIRLYGVSIQKDPVMIVSEYAPGMPPEMIELMNQCFAKEEARPSFVEICNSLSKRSALFRHLRAHVSRNMAVLKSLLQKTSSTDNCVSVDIALPTAAGTNDA